jgi:hypothetical protein
VTGVAIRKRLAKAQRMLADRLQMEDL